MRNSVLKKFANALTWILPRSIVPVKWKSLMKRSLLYTWLPAVELERIGVQREKKDVAFVMANGQQVTRNVGFAILRVDKSFTVDEVVFGEKGDLLLLGARTLEGLNYVVDSARKRLVAAGPLPAA